MFYHHPHTGGSAYSLWKRLLTKRATGSKRLQMWRSMLVNQYDKKYILWSASCIGNLSIIISIMNEQFEQDQLRHVIELASRYGHLHIVKWVHNMGCDSSYSLQLSCERGQLQVAKFLYKIGFCPRGRMYYYYLLGGLGIHKFTKAEERKRLRMAKWLYTIGVQSTETDDNWLIICASRDGHLEIVKWLYSIGYDPQYCYNSAIANAHKNGHHKIVDFLISIGCPDPQAKMNPE